jgi:hypothetical protein
MRNVLSLFAAILSMVLVFSPPARAAGADSGDDLNQTTDMAPLVWQPIIASYYVVESSPETTIVPSTQVAALSKSLIGELNQWTQLKAIIAPRQPGAGQPAYKDTETVLSGWHRLINDDGTVSYLTLGSNDAAGLTPDDGAGNGKPLAPKVLTFYSDLSSPIRIFADFDILMNRDPDKKDQKVKDYFKLLELKVSAYKVSDDPTAFRGAADENGNEDVIITHIVRPEGIQEELAPMLHAYNDKHFAVLKWSNGHRTGVFELRIHLRVSGRVDGAEEPQIKIVDGAIRIAFVHDKELHIDRLEWQTGRHPGQFDYYIGSLDHKRHKIPPIKNP